MAKISKWLLAALILGGIAVAVVYFLPAREREFLINAPKNTENAQPPAETSPETPSEAPAASAPVSKETEENASSTRKETAEAPSPSKNGVRIVQKPITWGFSVPSKKRSIDTIIVHSSYNALGGDTYDVDKLVEEYRQYGVSAHYLIDRKGTIYQLVKDQNIAYHAGTSVMPDGRTNVNTFSLGIELMNTQEDSYTDAQYDALNQLIAELKNEYPIKNVLGHNQIAPGRKTDPWNFDWEKISS